ncbi:MAG: polysaccharide deacetylase family protein [Fibrobacter sp.]|jgi:peptidoglycan/xylan/chitin deacetylase (PgdA/CDA1 family)|nr:polysaccharide deacetylase family protein [Fibrobacter sp.]
MHLKKSLFSAIAALVFLLVACSDEPQNFNGCSGINCGEAELSSSSGEIICDPLVMNCGEPPCVGESCEPNPELSSSSFFIEISSSSGEITDCNPLLTDCLPAGESSSSSETPMSSTVSSSSSSSSGEIINSSASGPAQATTCKTPLVTLGSVPADPYTACFRHTNSKCYVCKVSSEGEGNTCATDWVWSGWNATDGSNGINWNIENGNWYQEVTCPAGTSSSSAMVIPSSSSSGGTTPGCKANPATKQEIDACIDANWQAYGYSSRPTKVIALTFDDGPHSGTGTLLTALKNKNVKATFFVIGSNIRGNKSQAQAIYNDGHELGNHSDSYPSGAATTASVTACSNEIRGITGSNPKVFRAPNLQTVANLASTGLPDIWGCNTNDYTNGVNTLNSVKASGCAKDGGFLLMHESNTSNQNTVPRVGEIIDWLRSQGYWMLTVSQVAIYKGVTPVAGQRYNNF